MENAESNWHQVKKYDRFEAFSTEDGKAEYFVIDYNNVSANPVEHYFAVVKYNKGKRDVITPNVLDFNLLIDKEKLKKLNV